MKGEINKDFYCSANLFDYDKGKNPKCVTAATSDGIDKTCKGCYCYHRKHPTPEQFREEYGEDYPDDGAVYFLWLDSEKWQVNSLENLREMFGESDLLFYVVCACTPWGKPPNNWRPECTKEVDK